EVDEKPVCLILFQNSQTSTNRDYRQKNKSAIRYLSFGLISLKYAQNLLAQLPDIQTKNQINLLKEIKLRHLARWFPATTKNVVRAARSKLHLVHQNAGRKQKKLTYLQENLLLSLVII